jgi:hypothetical protein
MEQETVLFFRGDFLESFQDAGEKGAAENGRMVRGDQPADLGMFLPETPGMGLRLVMKILDGGLYFFPAVVTDPFLIVQYARNRSNSDSRALGDILDGGHGIAPRLFFQSVLSGRPELEPWGPNLSRQDVFYKSRIIFAIAKTVLTKNVLKILPGMSDKLQTISGKNRKGLILKVRIWAIISASLHPG